MLRLIGAIVVVVLVIGPLLLQAGMLDSAGAFRELVELEIRIFTEFVDWARLQMTRL